MTLLFLLIAIIMLVVIVAFLLGTGGVTVLLVFGDVIIGALIVYWIIRTIANK